MRYPEYVINTECHLGKLSAGAAADSAHEYLLKYYLLTGRKDRVMLEMCKPNQT